MLPRIKTILATLPMIVALCAVDSASASANWFIDGNELGAGQTAALSTTAKVDADTVFNFSKLKLKIICTGSLFRGTSLEIAGGNTGKAASLIFEGCSTTEPATGCEIENQPASIVTNPILATARQGPSKTSADRITFAPQVGAKFAEISLGLLDKCGLSSLTIKGTMTINAPTGQHEETLQAIEGLGSIENHSLESEGSKVYLEGGKALLKLASGSKWSFH